MGGIIFCEAGRGWGDGIDGVGVGVEIYPFVRACLEGMPWGF